MSFTSLNQSVWLCYQFLPALALMDGLDPDPDNVKTALNTVQKSAWAPMVQPKCLVELVPALEQVIYKELKFFIRWFSVQSKYYLMNYSLFEASNICPKNKPLTKKRSLVPKNLLEKYNRDTKSGNWHLSVVYDSFCSFVSTGQEAPIKEK